VGGVLRPAGLGNATGILTGSYIKDPTDQIWKDDAETKEWSAFMDRYYPDGDKTFVFTVFGYMAAEALAAVLKQCGDDLSRDNVMKQAASLEGLKLAAAGNHNQHWAG
jgi:branched-chain amino acid transport system substrate-binding protein